MLVSDVMTPDVVTVTVDRSSRDAVQRMMDHGIGSVVVEREGDPTGIVTRSDVLQVALQSGEPLSAIPIEDVMSHPLVSVAPDATVRAAVHRMREEDIKRLAVVDGIDLQGVVTQSDVVRNHSELLQEAIHHEERRQELDGDD